MMGETFTFSITPPLVFRHKSVEVFYYFKPISELNSVHFPCATCILTFTNLFNKLSIYIQISAAWRGVYLLIVWQQTK